MNELQELLKDLEYPVNKNQIINYLLILDAPIKVIDYFTDLTKFDDNNKLYYSINDFNYNF